MKVISIKTQRSKRKRFISLFKVSISLQLTFVKQDSVQLPVKSANSRGITQPATDILSFIFIECAVTLLPLVGYPLQLTTVSRYHPGDINGNIILPLHLGMYFLSDMVCLW